MKYILIVLLITLSGCAQEPVKNLYRSGGTLYISAEPNRDQSKPSLNGGDYHSGTRHFDPFDFARRHHLDR